MSAGLVILGTDTGVGKTHVACALARGLRARGWAPSALKPVESGYSATDSDGRRLAEACGESFEPERHVPQRFKLPLAPLAAGREEGHAFDAGFALRHASERAATCDLLILETAGGIRVPLNEEMSNIELAQQLKWPALLVARATLGTINHSVLTLEAAARARIKLIGFVLNGEAGPSSRAGGGNRGIIEQMSGVPCAGEIPLDAGGDASEHLDWDIILSAVGREKRAT
jgi:dethiobiotin synthetase